MSAHCLPIFREDGDDLLWETWMDGSPEPSPRADALDELFDESPQRDTTPSAGDSPHGSLLGGISGSSLDSTETLKHLLRSGMRAISQFVTKEDDDIL